MPWDDSINAGFTTGNPWLPLNDDYQIRNVAAYLADQQSVLNLYRRLIELRRDYRELCFGRFATVFADSDLLAFERSHGDVRLLVILNFVQEQRQFHLPAGAAPALVVLSTCLDRENEYVRAALHLRGSEGLILKLLPSEGVIQ
jgi:alpha-glucosidase